MQQKRRQNFLRLKSGVAALVLGVWLGIAVRPCPADQFNLRFLGSDFAVLPSLSNLFPVPNDANARALVFTVPPAFPTAFLSPTNATEAWTRMNNGGSFPNNPLAENSWPLLTNYFYTNVPCGLSMDYGSVYLEVNINSYLWPMPPPATADQALQVALNWWLTNAPVPGEQFTTAQFNPTMNIKGGQFNGTKLKLNGVLASAAVLDPLSNPDYQVAFADLFFAVDWGSDVNTNREFVIFHFSIEATATVDGPCLSVANVCQAWLGQPDPFSYAQQTVKNLVSQLNGGSSAYFQGAPPDLLCFYDFSGDHTVPPLTTLPEFSGVFNFYPLHSNQYDAGPAFGLPTASSDKTRPGGNACGPVSLAMAMNAAGVFEPDLPQVFSDTMQLGLSTNGAQNGFLWPKANDWLKGKTNYEGVPFPSPLSTPVPSDFLYATNPASITAGWTKIDGLLSSQQPVLLGTDLGAGTAPGGGHVILLLGKWQSDLVGQLYGTSGNYYVVADPAGHYYANQSSGQHYQTVGLLETEWDAINYGGWFAMYPAETLQGRITSGTNGPMLRALTIGKPFSSALQIQVHSPVIIMVTDSLGNQTGLQTNGTVVEAIPNSAYEPAMADSEDESSIDPAGPKTVRIDTPMAGTYRVDLTGTDSGSYTLDWQQINANGTAVGTNTYTGTVFPGQVISYFINAVPTGPPPLLFTHQANALVLFWPTNYAGFTVQANPTPTDTNGWATISGASAIGAFNFVTNPIGTANQFFRLKH